MTVSESTLKNQIIKTIKTNIGDLYFFDNMVIAEFYEGEHVSFKNSVEIIKSLHTHFGTEKSFGFISNMINSFSIEPLDTLRFKDEINNMAAYANVCYNEAGKMNALIENSFLNNENICYSDLNQAVTSIENKLKEFAV